MCFVGPSGRIVSGYSSCAGIRPRVLALAETELDGVLQERRIFFLGLGGERPPLLEDYCMLGVGLVDHSRLLSPLLFFTPFFILPEEINGWMDWGPSASFKRRLVCRSQLGMGAHRS